MSATIIRCIYEQEPNFPATDQHPDAVRYKIGDVWVDAIGGEPSQGAVTAILSPAAPPPVTKEALQGQLDDLQAAIEALA